MREKRNICRFMVGELDESRQMGRVRCRRENSIKMGIKEKGREGVE
jgi:hypothetical protein